MHFRHPILAISDLTERSDAAVHVAGKLAGVLGAELHILHAMGMKYRALRAVVPALNNLSATLAGVDRLLREQVERALGDTTDAPAVHVVDLDDPLRALPLRARQLTPTAIVTPGIWDWTSSETRRRSGMTAVLASLKVPVLAIREPRWQRCQRVLVISSPEANSSRTIEAAGRWGSWLDQVYGRNGVRADAAVDALLLEPGVDQAELIQRITGQPPDLTVIDKGVLRNEEIASLVDAVMPVVLDQRAVPVAFLPDAPARFTEGPGRARYRTPMTAA